MNSFESTYQDNYRRLWGVAQKMINNKDAVADIVQDVFIAYYHKTLDDSCIQQPKSWLMRATINKCIDFSKRQSKFERIDTLNSIVESENINTEFENKNWLKVVLSKLNEKERALVILYSEGLSYKEIAEVTDVKVTSVGKTLSRALKKLNSLLKTHHYEMF